MRDSFLPPMPLVFPLAATADKRSKKSKIMRLRASESTLRGMNVSNACRAKLESKDPSAFFLGVHLSL